MRGRLKAKASFWATFCSSFILVWIMFGVSFEWNERGQPARAAFKNQATALKEKEFVSEAVQKLIATGAAYKVRKRPHIVSPIGVAYREVDPNKPLKKRLIFNGRYLNRHLVIPKFKYESLSMVRDLLVPSGYMWYFDLTAGYHHVDVHEDFHKYLGFEWEGEYYQYAVLPFGLAIAPYVFTRITRELSKKWRKRGARMISYIDDFIFFGKATISGSIAHILIFRDQVLKDLEDAGFVVSMEKSQLDPRQISQFLGFGIDSLRRMFFVPEKKIEVLLNLIIIMRAGSRTTARKLSKIAGKIISLGFALGRVTRMFTREMYFCIETATTWDGVIKIPNEVEEELDFWLTVDFRDFCEPIWRCYSNVLREAIFSDAGKSGWGGWLAPQNFRKTRLEARSHLTMFERTTSSTYRELIGILGNLQAFISEIKGKCVMIFTDSDNCAKILEKGCSGKSNLHHIAVEIFWFCKKNLIQLEVQWIPRKKNDLADYLAAIYDKDDWKLSEFWFGVLNAKWGPHTIDRFATDKNALLPRFNSAWYCPNTSGVNCFSLLDWMIENNWCNPPFTLIGRLICLLEEQKAAATVIVPMWTGRHWWPILCPNGRDFARFVVDWMELPRNSWKQPLFLPGAGRANEIAVGPPNFRVFALRIDFRNY